MSDHDGFRYQLHFHQIYMTLLNAVIQGPFTLGKQLFGYQRIKILVIKDGKTRIQNKPVLFRKQTLGSYAVLTKPYIKRAREFNEKFGCMYSC